jgi:hypothetical protein
MATGALDANGIWQYGEDDSETTASALLNKLGSSTSDTVTRLEDLSGLTVEQYATHRANLRVGMTKIIPTSVTFIGGSGSSTNGVTNFSAVTGVSLRGVFSAEFDNYLVRYVAGNSGNTETRFRLMSGATIDTTNSYGWSSFVYNSTALSFNGGSAGTTHAYMGSTSVNANETNGILNISSPFLTTVKAYHYENTLNGSTSQKASGMGGGTSSRDGIHIYPTASSITGRIVIYGFNR